MRTRNLLAAGIAALSLAACGPDLDPVHAEGELETPDPAAQTPELLPRAEELEDQALRGIEVQQIDPRLGGDAREILMPRIRPRRGDGVVLEAPERFQPRRPQQQQQ